jgi:hypothetical protein
MHCYASLFLRLAQRETMPVMHHHVHLHVGKDGLDKLKLMMDKLKQGEDLIMEAYELILDLRDSGALNITGDLIRSEAEGVPSGPAVVDGIIDDDPGERKDDEAST